MDVQQAVFARVRRQGHFREVDGGNRSTVVAVLDQLLGHFQADVGLGFGGRTTDVRGQDHAIQAAQRALELLVVGLGFDREHVDGGADQVLVLDGFGQGVQLDHGAAGGVDQDAALLDRADFLLAHHPLGGGQLGHMQGDDVGHAQQLVQVAHLGGVAQRQLGHGVIEEHLHAEGFGQYRQLGADRAVADDAELLAADLEGVGRGLDPAATVAGSVLLRDAAQQQDGLGQHQFGHRTGVGVRGVEHRDAALAGGVQVDLVGADAEAADGDQLLGAVEDFLGQLGTRTDADEVSVGDLFLQLVTRQRALQVLDVGVASGLQGVHGVLVDTFEKKELDLALVERGRLAHLRKPVVPGKLAGRWTARAGRPASRRRARLAGGIC
ncbi:hypothetical protein D9M73_129990 [compost metagenome]